MPFTNNISSPATDVKEKITKFKEEKIGSRRKDFVETVKAEGAASSIPAGVESSGDAMDTSQ